MSSEVETRAATEPLGARPSTPLGTNGREDHPQAKPFGHPDRAQRDVAAALTRAAREGHRVILVFGANWCHDSRALAGWFATPRFRDMLAPRYEVVWIDVGKKDKNLDLARRFGLDGIAGTPTVLIVDAAGKALNLADAPGWRNASTRTSDAIFDYFAKR
ncbi:MAG: thioredoxin family protein [Sphingomonas sp.]|nr:MAG: thioredoxin family protein [Sphingomonas sp.]